jgi:hypothetical protein
MPSYFSAVLSNFAFIDNTQDPPKRLLKFIISYSPESFCPGSAGSAQKSQPGERKTNKELLLVTFELDDNFRRSLADDVSQTIRCLFSHVNTARAGTLPDPVAWIVEAMLVLVT